MSVFENTTGFTIDDLWYSQYYCLNALKQKYNKKTGYNEGINQKQFELFEQIEQNGFGVDWDIVKIIEQSNS